jgi:hypothetical protein
VHREGEGGGTRHVQLTARHSVSRWGWMASRLRKVVSCCCSLLASARLPSSQSKLSWNQVREARRNRPLALSMQRAAARDERAAAWCTTGARPFSTTATSEKRSASSCLMAWRM